MPNNLLDTDPQTPVAIARASSKPPPPYRRVLRRGDSGPDVAAWQRALHAAGLDSGALDGSFGPLVEIATREVQRRAGLLVDGVVGDRTRAAATDMAVTPLPAVCSPGLGLALLEVARAELAAGAREEPPGSNDGQWVRRYFAGSGISPPAHWCARFLVYCLEAAARSCRVAAPIVGSAAAGGWQEQLIRARRWRTVAELRAAPSLLREGMVVVWHRGPPGSWTRHIGVVSRVEGYRFRSVEGNSGARGDRVAEMPHDLSDARLLGAGWVD